MFCLNCKPNLPRDENIFDLLDSNSRVNTIKQQMQSEKDKIRHEHAQTSQQRDAIQNNYDDLQRQLLLLQQQIQAQGNTR